MIFSVPVLTPPFFPINPATHMLSGHFLPTLSTPSFIFFSPSSSHLLLTAEYHNILQRTVSSAVSLLKR